jgi:hypothetical protein
VGSIFGGGDEEEVKRLRQQHLREEAAKRAKRKRQDDEAKAAFDKGQREAAERAARKAKMASGNQDKNKSGGICGVMVLAGLATFAVAAAQAVRAVV